MVRVFKPKYRLIDCPDVTFRAEITSEPVSVLMKWYIGGKRASHKAVARAVGIPYNLILTDIVTGRLRMLRVE